MYGLPPPRAGGQAKPLLAPYSECVKYRARLVAWHFYPLLQEPPIDYGALLQRAPSTLSLRTDGSRTFSASSRASWCTLISSHRTKINP